MPQIRNRSSDALHVPLYGLMFEAGEEKEVDDDTAVSLVANPNFEQVKPKPVKADKEQK